MKNLHMFTHNNGDFGSIFVMQQCGTAPILKVDRHILDKFLSLFVIVWIGIQTVVEVNE